MEPPQAVIRIHVQAPHKPVVGAHCNGCGVCCLAEPCPLGVLLSRTRTGACSALRWSDMLGQYRCGAMVVPRELLEQALPKAVHGLARMLSTPLGRWASRWIAAGSGCDCELETEDGPH